MSGTTAVGARPAARGHRRISPRGVTGASRGFAWLLIVSGALGALASLVITIDKIRLLEDPLFSPSCNLSPVLSCGSVMQSAQASVFGLPNPVLGLLAYPVIVTIGVVLLSGARFSRSFWLGLNAGTLLGAAFCMWLMTQALYEIGALCLWCCLAWAATIAMFWYTTAHNLRHGVIGAPRTVVAGVLEFHWVVPLTWCLIIVVLIATRWWDYWQTLV